MVFSHSQMFHFPGRIHGNWYTIAIHRSLEIFFSRSLRPEKHNVTALPETTRSVSVGTWWGWFSRLRVLLGGPWIDRKSSREIRPCLSPCSQAHRSELYSKSQFCLAMPGDGGGQNRFFREVGIGICEFEMMKCQQKLHVTLWDGASPRSAGCECWPFFFWRQTLSLEFCDVCMIPCCRERYVYLKFQLTVLLHTLMGQGALHAICISFLCCHRQHWHPPHPPHYHHHCCRRHHHDHTSYITHHTSYIIHHTSYIIHHTSYIIHHTSHIIHHTSYIIHHTSHITHHTSYIIHHTSYIIHHTLHITHHTSYIIHHTSYIMHHTSYIIHHSSHITHHTSS